MLIKAIDSFLENRPKDDRPKHCFHPSSLHKSIDELYRHYLNGDNSKKFEPRVLRIFDNGHGVHNRLQGYLKEIGILKQAEIPVENAEYEIKGHADGIIDINGVSGVLEIKSMNTNQFYSAYDPKPEHLIQINVYMFCLQTPRGCLLYECKDNQKLKKFYVKMDSSVLNPVLAKIKQVQEKIRAKEREITAR